jgi:hypothetical protein
MVGLFSRIPKAVRLQEEAAKTKGDRRIRSETRKIEDIATICELGKMHARAMRDNSLDAGLLAERKNYEMYKHDAIVSARRLREPTLRDFSLRHIIDLCMCGGDDSEAKHFFNLMEADAVKREILEVHPQLASRPWDEAL